MKKINYLITNNITINCNDQTMDALLDKLVKIIREPKAPDLTPVETSSDVPVAEEEPFYTPNNHNFEEGCNKGYHTNGCQCYTDCEDCGYNMLDCECDDEEILYHQDNANQPCDCGCDGCEEENCSDCDDCQCQCHDEPITQINNPIPPPKDEYPWEDEVENN